MFKDKYDKSLNNISPDGYIKQKVLLKIKNRNADIGFFGRRYVKVSFAAALCLVIALSSFAVWRVVKNPFDNKINNETKITESELDLQNQNVGSQKPNEEINSQPNVSKPADNDHKIHSNSSDYNTYRKIYDKISKLDFYSYYYDDIIFEEFDGMADAETIVPSSPPTSGTDKDSFKGDSDFSDSSNKPSSPNFSNTTTQVKDVDEADIVKTDGEYIYAMSKLKSSSYGNEDGIRIIKAGINPQLISTIQISEVGTSLYANEMFLYNKKLTVFFEDYNSDYEKISTVVKIYDVSNPKKPKIISTLRQSGSYYSSRMIQDKIYLITDNRISYDYFDEKKPETYVPSIYAENHNGVVKADDVYIQDYCTEARYSVVASYNMSNGCLIDSCSILGGTKALYCSLNNIVIAGYAKSQFSKVVRFAINDGKIDLSATGEIKGGVLNQFSISEHNGYFRFVTTDRILGISRNNLLILDGKLKKVGSIENVAPNEEVKSVHFMGDTAYFVTFRQTDPLFSVDLSNVKAPKILGKLKIPGFSEYLFPYGEGKLLGVGLEIDEETGEDLGVKLSMFDISNPANVTELDKFVIKGSYSIADNTHKAIFYDSKRNLIGVPVEVYDGNTYYLFSFKDNKFVKNNAFPCHTTTRGLYIDDIFYIVSDYFIELIDLTKFKFIDVLDFYLSEN